MENKYYVRIQEDKFGFVVDGIHDILADVDHAITNEDYDRFFELQSKGKQFRVKDVPTGEGLFDLIEEYVPEPLPPVPPSDMELLLEEVLNQSEMILEMDFRLTSIELGL